ncbi:MAG: protein kinase [bacterium]
MKTMERWSEVERLLAAALEVPTKDRDGFLERACAGDTELRNEVLSLLRAHDRSGPLEELSLEFLEPLIGRAFNMGEEERAAWRARVATDPSSTGDTGSDSGIVDKSRNQFGDREGGALGGYSLEGVGIGGYTLERPLGRGGMGSVWLARRTDGRFEGFAAVKLLNHALSSKTGQERFRREGSMLARLAHPGIARLLDAGVTAHGQPYIVLEHVDGQRIDAFADEKRLSRDARLRLFLQVLAAVGHAHANLIVHRDLKPSNILVTADGTVKLLDFGIAKLLEEDGSGERTALTVEGGRPLTPEYAAPEQVRGEAITTATDVYALGVLLYGLLSGRHPTGEGRRTPVETLHALLDVEPTRLEIGDLDAVLTKALRKAARERYQTVATFADDVERYLRREPVRARPDSLWYRAGKFVRRNRSVVAAMCITFVALIGATYFSVKQMREAERQRDSAVNERRRGEALRDFENSMMSRLGARPITMRGLLDEGRTILEKEYDGDPAFLGVILVDMAQRYDEVGDSYVGQLLLARAESLAVAGQGNENLAEIRCQIAENLRGRNKLDDARRALESGESMLRDHPDPRAEMVCLTSRSEIEALSDHADKAEVAIRRAIAIRDSLGETRQAGYLSLLNTLAGSFESQYRFREGLAVYRHISALLDTLGRGNTFNSVVVQFNTGTTLINLGEFAEAERTLHRVLERAAQTDSTGTIPLRPLGAYAQAASLNGHVDSSVKYYRLLADQARRESDTTFIVRGLLGLVRAQARLGRVADARKTAAEYGVLRAKLPKPLEADDEALAAWLTRAAGDSAAAYQHFVNVLKLSGYYDGKRTLQQRQTLVAAAEIGIGFGKIPDAMHLLGDARAISAFDSLAETRSGYMGDVGLLQGRALLARGDTAAARATLVKARVALMSAAGATHPRTRELDSLVARIR